MDKPYIVATEEETERLSTFRTEPEASKCAKNNAEMNPGQTFFVLYPWSQYRIKPKFCKCNHEFTIYEPNFCGTCGEKR